MLAPLGVNDWRRLNGLLVPFVRGLLKAKGADTDRKSTTWRLPLHLLAEVSSGKIT